MNHMAYQQQWQQNPAQGYNTINYGQPMQPQMYQQMQQPVQQPQQFQYQNPPANLNQIVPNYPIQGQQVNRSRAGLEMEKVKQDVVNMMFQRANEDGATRIMLQRMQGVHGNWNTESTFRMVELVMFYFDVQMALQPGADPNQVYTYVLGRMFSNMWGNIIATTPQLLNDPTVQARHQDYLNVMQQLEYDARLLTQYGYKDSYAPVQTNTHQNNNFGYNQMRYQSAPPRNQDGTHAYGVPANAVNQGNQYSNVAQPNWNGNGQQSHIRYHNEGREVSRSITSIYDIEDMMKEQRQTVQSSQPVYEQQPVQQNTGYDFSQMNNQVPHKPTISERLTAGEQHYLNKAAAEEVPAHQRTDRCFIELPKYTEEEAEVLRMAGQTILESQIITRENQGFTAKENTWDGTMDFTPNAPTFSSPNSVPQGTEVVYDYTKDNPTVGQSWDQLMGNLDKASKTPELVREVNLNDTNVLAQQFAAAQVAERKEQAKQEETNKEQYRHPGLWDDEIALLDKSQVYNLFYNRGYKFEKPYSYPVTGDPNKVYIFCTLTKHKTLRMSIYKRGTDEELEMRFCSHEDILKDTRNSFVVKKDLKALNTWETTSRGGIIFDRFKESNIRLRNELAKINEETDPAKRAELIDKAFGFYQEQIEEDVYNYDSGVAQWRQDKLDAGEIEEGEEIGLYPEEVIMPKEDLDLAAEEAKDKIKIIHDPSKVLATYSVQSAPAEYELKRITDLDPEVNDAIVIRPFEGTSVLGVFNNPKEREETLDLIDKVLYDPTVDKDVDILDTLPSIVRQLKENRDKLPLSIYSKLERSLTDEVNNCVKHILGYYDMQPLDNVIDQWDDLIEWAKDTYLPNTVNGDVALRIFTKYLQQHIQNIGASSEQITLDNNEDVDLLQLRAITAVKRFEVMFMPMTAASMGLGRESEIINVSTDDMMYGISANLLTQHLYSGKEDSQFNAVYNGLYMYFQDGVMYKVYPTCGLQQVDYNELEDDEKVFFDTISLMRV